MTAILLRIRPGARWLAALAAIAIAGLQFAHMPPALAGDATPTPAAIVEALLPEKTGPLTRSLAKSVTRGISIEGELPADLDLPKVNLIINFEFNSARLTNDGMLTLKALGQALGDKKLAGMQFQIAGHTDDVGTEEYNQDLSERRAKAVVTHLVSFYGIAPERLKPVGYGKKQLAVPSDPKAAANRRVVIINLAPLSS